MVVRRWGGKGGRVQTCRSVAVDCVSIWAYVAEGGSTLSRRLCEEGGVSATGRGCGLRLKDTKKMRCM